jgi:hypothetical protein
MRRAIAFGALALAAGLAAPVAAQEPGTPGFPKRAPNLTCTFIAKQCNIGCVKEAPQEFCQGYCNRTKLDCIQTGNWTGIRRRYTGVQKR